MAVKSLAQSSLKIASSTNSMLAGYSFQDFHHLETVQLGGSASSVTFNNLLQYSGEFRHLQIRMAIDSTVNSSIKFTFNSDSASNYSFHWMEGNGSSVVSSAVANHGSCYMGYSFSGFAAFVTDILDPFETTKNTTARTLSGTTDGGNRIYLTSSSWRNTNAVTTIQVFNESGSFTLGSRFSLYGIR